MKSRILQAAAQELHARGLKFTVDAVASRLGISKKTLYVHFPSKEALIAGVIDAMLTDVDSQRQTILVTDMGLAERLAAVLTVKPKLCGKMNDLTMKDIRRSYPAEWDKIQNFHRRQVALILDLLEEGKKTGDIRPVNSHVAAVMLTGAVSKLLDQNFLSEQNLTISGVMQAITDLFLNGVLQKPNSQYGGAA
jgi:AcrR family transcriptional regulator